MNVKIDHEGLRFRITAEELEQLQRGDPLKEVLQIGRRSLAIVIDPVAVGNDLAVIYDEDTIRLNISPARVTELAAMGRSREGLEQETDHFITALQVDFRTQKRQSA